MNASPSHSAAHSDTGRFSKARLTGRVLVLLLGSSIAGCSRSPAQDIFGSYFPAWLICLACGIVAAVLVRAVLLAIGLGEHVFAPLLGYPAMALAFTFGLWLAFFAN